MKEICRISFLLPEKRETALKRMLERIGCGDGYREPVGIWVRHSFEQTLDVQEPRFSALVELLRQEGIHATFRRDKIYSSEELRAFTLLEFAWAGQPRDTGRQPQEVYDFSTGCPTCHTCARQIGPLRIKPELLPGKRPICYSMDGFTLVTEPVHQALTSANLSGLELRQVVSPKGKRLAWWQIDSRYEMPAMAPETKGVSRGTTLSGRDEGCPECRRDNWFTEGSVPTEIAYRRSDLGPGPVPDVCLTYERFGVSDFETNGHLAQPLLLVSPRFMDIVLSLKIRGLVFNPVTIVDR